MKRFPICLALIILMIGVCGCAMDHTDAAETTGNQVVLNERQLEILAAEGLPTDYSELTHRQRAAIAVIEEMLTAVESKYGMAFVYVSYYDGEILDNEQLTVYPKNGNPETDTFTVTRSRDEAGYTYSDDYADMLAVPLFEAFVQEFADSQLGSGNARVFSAVFNVECEGLPRTTADIIHRVDGNSLIFMDGANVTAAQLADFAGAFEAWCRENGITGSSDLILLKAGELKYLSQYNYTDYLSEDHYTDRVSCN